VFPSQSGSLLQAGNLRRRAFKPTAEEAGVPWAGFHTLRHTCASLMFAEGRTPTRLGSVRRPARGAKPAEQSRFSTCTPPDSAAGGGS